MKRRLLIIAIFLLLGAVVNVAVAWGCAALSDYEDLLYVYDHEPLAESVVERVWPPGWPRDVRFLADKTSHCGVTLLHLEAEDGHLIVEELQAGVPLRCLVGRFNWASTGTWPSRIVGAWPVPLQVQGKGSFLPLRPIWPGFAINTLFYATILWLLLLGAFALRRFLRVRRGQCFACGYDLGHAEHAACPECGGSGPAIAARQRR